MTALLAIAISFLSLCIAALAFYRGTPSAQNKILKKEKMKLLAARTVIVWDQMHTLINARVNNFRVDGYFFPSYKRNIHRLEEALDEAISVGLFEDVVGKTEMALPLHTAFIQSLANMESLESDNAGLDDWIKEHFVMGMVRLIGCCLCTHPYALPKGLRDYLLSNYLKLKDDASNYLRNSK